MPYTPTIWENDSPPAINADNLNKIEEQLVIGITTDDKATTEQAIAGVDDTKWMTPKKVSELTAQTIGLVKNDAGNLMQFEPIFLFIDTKYPNIPPSGSKACITPDETKLVVPFPYRIYIYNLNSSTGLPYATVTTTEANIAAVIVDNDSIVLFGAAITYYTFNESSISFKKSFSYFYAARGVHDSAVKLPSSSTSSQFMIAGVQGSPSVLVYKLNKATLDLSQITTISGYYSNANYYFLPIGDRVVVFSSYTASGSYNQGRLKITVVDSDGTQHVLTDEGGEIYEYFYHYGMSYDENSNTLYVSSTHVVDQVGTANNEWRAYDLGNYTKKYVTTPSIVGNVQFLQNKIFFGNREINKLTGNVVLTLKQLSSCQRDGWSFVGSSYFGNGSSWPTINLKFGAGFYFYWSDYIINATFGKLFGLGGIQE